MRSRKNKWMLFVLPIVAGLGVFLFSSGFSYGSEERYSRYRTFEFTVWGDTLRQGRAAGVQMVNLSARETAKASMILLKNDSAVLPFRHLEEKRFHLLSLGRPVPVFEATLRKYGHVTAEWAEQPGVRPASSFDGYNPVIVAVNDPKCTESELRKYLDEIAEYTEVVVVNFSDYWIMREITHFATMVQAPNEDRIVQDVAAQALFGGLPFRRGIPDEWKDDLNLQDPDQTETIRLAYSEPEYLGISSDSLSRIEEIISEGIEQFAMPGCQVLVAKAGHVIYHRSFGYHTYERKRPVRNSDIYDLASITKVAATTLASMKMYEEGKLSLSARVGDYLHDGQYASYSQTVTDTMPVEAYFQRVSMENGRIPRGDTLRYQDSLFLLRRTVAGPEVTHHSQVFDIRLADLLTHTSGLQAGLPIGPYMRRSAQDVYSTSYSEDYSIPVANRLYMRENYLDSLWNVTKGLSRDSSRYRYSCVNMIVMQRVIDSLAQSSMSDLLQQEFYDRLGLQTMGYNPRELYDLDRLVPTSSDIWRGQMLCGTVHDPTAALMGGISGNAGLFSNANDLGILAQMWLNGGSYGGEQLLQDTTVARFAQKQRGHRGFGFDMAPKNSEYLVAESASSNTFGHTGFTGTCVWVDPVNDLVFVFLSNRIHPSPKNFKINELRIRQRVHQVVYDALGIPSRIPQIIMPRRLDRNQPVLAMNP
ncbi:serine hydrolase [Pontibacter sp. G13]|uniref:serine hydrolase n=1 Tax=Pontibacter sp. G13 TaxID=3074898 RepID=UPI00288AE02C|nr:serine hydrolase [Pontibacter sp. G13]WNJ16220.1 serine hydrolase [Pontibacter sp. G13]